MYQPFRRIEIETPAQSPEAERREMLIAALRDRSKWPESFVWDWTNCDQCAMGLCVAIMAPGVRPYAAQMAELLGLTERVARNLFVSWAWNGCKTPSPENIADRLELIHRARAARAAKPER